MADFEDLKLERASGDEPPPSRSSIPWLPIAAAVLLLAGAVWYFFFRSSAPDAVEVRTETTQAGEEAPVTRPTAEPGEDIPLPPLGESDVLVRELVAKLSSHPRVAAWLTTDDLIRNFTVVVLNIANGQTPAVHLKAVPLTGRFQVRENSGEVLIDPRSYERYNGHADAVAAVDARGAARLYATLKPRITEAYHEFGAPDGDFDQTLERAIVELLRTPVVEGDVRLKADGALYAFADPALQSLSKAQRQLLRTGPRNVRIVQAKLREIAPFLGIPAESLPPETIIGR